MSTPNGARQLLEFGSIRLYVFEAAGRKQLGKCYQIDEASTADLGTRHLVQLNPQEAAAVAKALARELDLEELLEAAVTDAAFVANADRYGKEHADSIRHALLHGIKALRAAKSAAKAETRRISRGGGA